MTKNYLLTASKLCFLLAFMFIFCNPSFGQREVMVTPGFGTLNTAIFGDTLSTGERTDTNTVYVLERDGLYLLDGTIENRFPLSIVAEDGNGARPILQPGVATGGSSSRALTPRAHITLRGLYVTNLDELGGLNTRIMRARGDDMRIIIDDCHFDKDGQSGIRVDNPGMKIYITNSIFSNIGLMSSPNNGRGIDDRGNPIDSLVVENSLIYNLTSRFLRDDGGLLNYAKVNNNTFYNLGQGSIHFGETVFALCQNNLFVNTSFLGNATEESPGGMRFDSLSQANIDAGLEQCVIISHNNFYNDPALANAYPDTVRSFRLFNVPAQNFMEVSGYANTNTFEWLTFDSIPGSPTNVVTSYYATLTDPDPNPDNMDDGNGGPNAAGGQMQFPFNFDYMGPAGVVEGSNIGGAMGDGNSTAVIDTSRAPRVVTVAPGFGSLNTAIFGDTLANGERVDTNTVYVLERDGLYLLDGTIENRFPLAIVAEEGDGARPILQPGVATGGSSSRALTPRAHITLRGLYVTNLDELGGLNTRIMRARGDDMRIIIDDCHFDKDGQSGIRVDNPGMKIYITNSIFSNIGLMSSPNNGRGIDDRGNPIDSIVVENSTIYNLTSRFIRDDGGLTNYARVVHNTFYNLGQGSIHFGEIAELICVNNLFSNTSFLGKNFDEVVGGMRMDSLSQANQDLGFIQRVNISFNNFHLDTAIVSAYPDSVQEFALFDTTTAGFINNQGYGPTNQGRLVSFTTPPSIPTNVVTTYYATITDPDPNPDNMDDGNGGPGMNQMQLPFDFSYEADAIVSEGSTKGIAMGSMQWVGEVAVGIFDPVFAEEIQLSNYPNPFRDQTTISYELANTSEVELAIFDLSGRMINKIVDQKQPAGSHEVLWNAGELRPGIYLYRIQVNGRIFSKKLILMGR
ncbi:MAG: T9SS type A sorting domain-containing protein [Bacteroidia bacterium]|nr:T9SS type A sorting domain-containing protein [Bacteroidia bacterium]